MPPTPNLSGKVTLDGQPIALAEVTFVTLDSATPRVFTTAITEGKYQFSSPIPSGKYAVMLTGRAKPPIPDRYQSVQSSGLVVEITTDKKTIDLNLQSK